MHNENVPRLPKQFRFISCSPPPGGKHTKHRIPRSTECIPLNVGVVRDGRDRLREVTLGFNDVGLPGLSGLSLQVDVDALLLGLLLLDGVLLDTLEEVLTGAGVGDVLDAHVDALLDVAVADTLVDDDTDGGLGHVVDHTSLAVVVLVGHTVHISVNGPPPDVAAEPALEHGSFDEIISR